MSSNLTCTVFIAPPYNKLILLANINIKEVDME
nr:MAG TPA: hypothetical protein [Caudoviricetes sp.]